MRDAWRFFVCDTGGWTWQRISQDGVVVAESHHPLASYDACVRHAASRGYVFVPSQPRLAPSVPAAEPIATTSPGCSYRMPQMS